MISSKLGRIKGVPPLLIRYFTREIIGWYIAGIFLFLTLQMVDVLSSTISNLLAYKPPLLKALAAFLAYLPTLVNRTLVLAVPFSILLTFSRMQRDNELKAIMSSGIKPLSLVWPLVLPFSVVGVLAFYNAGTLVPAGLKNWDAAWYSIYNRPASPPEQSKYTYAPAGALYYAGRIIKDKSSQNAQLYGVMVQRGDEIMTASTGLWDTKTQTWQLASPWITKAGQRPYQSLKTVTVPQTDTLRPPPASAQKVSNAELKTALAGNNPDHNNPDHNNLDRNTRREYTFQLATRYADPLTPVVFALAAGMLGLLIRNRAAAFAAVLVFIVCFYVLWTTMPQLGRSGALDPTFAAWVPNLFFLAFAGILAWRLR